MSAEEVLIAFQRDAPYLFLGGAFTAVGILSAAFAGLRRKRDSLLIYFALFAILYGLRLWFWSSLFAMLVEGSIFHERLRGAVNYVILVPAFQFFISLGLARRFERAVGYTMVGFGCVLAALTFVLGGFAFTARIHSIAFIGEARFFLGGFMAVGL